MDKTRMILGVLLVVSLPPAVLFWLLIHPFARFWRRLGPRPTYLISGILFSLLVLALYLSRATLMGPDLGTNWSLFVVGCILYFISAWISIVTRRQLDNRTFAGLPEISPEESKGVLLQEGIYSVVRHPRYVSVIIGIAGFAMVVNYLGLYLVYLGSILALLLVVVFEEQELANRFGTEYEEYRSRVPAFIPRFRSKVKGPLLGILFLAPLPILNGCSEQTDISFVVIVKSSNYAQDSEGRLELLNYHFFSEIFLRPGGSLTSATMTRSSDPAEPMNYESRGDNYYFEGGHFDSEEDVDLAHPNDSYVLNLEAPTVTLRDFTLELEGPDGETDIPAPIRVSLWQEDGLVPPVSVDPTKDLVVRWSTYSNGVEDPRGIVDDMIFLVIADCHGERIVHTGLPFQGEYTTFRTTEMGVEAGTLRPGHPYSVFVEFPHVVDSRIEQGVPGFTSYATATYFDLRTKGERTDQACPEAPPPMDTGQTNRMDSTAVH